MLVQCRVKEKNGVKKVDSKICISCGQSFFNQNKYFSRQKYCSKKCKQKQTDIRRSKKENRLISRRKIDLRYRNKNLDKRRKAYSTWTKSKRGKILRSVSCSCRHKRVKKQTPPWADLEAIKKIYLLCKEMNLKENIYQVDHIYPLNGKEICGLHIAENLTIITAKQNQQKGNKLPNQPDQ